MVRQRKGIGITAMRCCGYHQHCSLRMPSRPTLGVKKMPRTLILVRWAPCSCQVGWFSRMVSLVWVTCSMPTPLVVLVVKCKSSQSVAHLVGPLHSTHNCLFPVPTGYARSMLILELL